MKIKVLTCDDMDRLDFEPTLIVCFYQSNKQKQVLNHYAMLKKQYPKIDMIGCSSESNIYDQIPYIEGDSRCLFMCLKLEKDAYRLELRNNTEERLRLPKDKSYNTIMFSSQYFEKIENWINDIQDELGGYNLFGAIAGVSDVLTDTATVFYNGKFYDEHVLLWLIDVTYYRLDGLSVHQFQPVGFEFIVTKSFKDTIYELDHRPALKVLEEVVGCITAQNIQSFDFPFFLKRSDMVSFDESPLSSIKTIDKVTGSISLYRYVKEHDKLKLAIPLSSKEQEDRLKQFHKFHKREDSIAFLFNCVGIKAYLGMMEFVYLMDLKYNLKMPFVGFHSFGEIGPIEINQKSILHNQTISLAILSPVKDRV